MKNQEIRIVTLPAMRVVSFHAFGPSPEAEAWEKMSNWAKAHACWQDPPVVRIFGFNNPDPSAGSPNYGYEFWVTINPDEQVDGDARIEEFSGGLYGVLNCDVSSGDPGDIIPSTWSKLVTWLESSHYKHGNHQWLEEHLTRGDSVDNGFILDLYIPISE
jgi:AraC family transcriptional regulator